MHLIIILVAILTYNYDNSPIFLQRIFQFWDTVSNWNNNFYHSPFLLGVMVNKTWLNFFWTPCIYLGIGDPTIYNNIIIRYYFIMKVCSERTEATENKCAAMKAGWIFVKIMGENRHWEQKISSLNDLKGNRSLIKTYVLKINKSYI